MKKFSFLILGIFAVGLGFWASQISWFHLKAQISDTRIPYPPYGLQSSAAYYNQITVGWTSDPTNDALGISVTGFKISRRNAYSGNWTILGMVNAGSYTDLNVTPGNYDYTVNACNTNGCSNNANFTTLNLIQDTQAPSAPASINLPQKEVTSSNINIYWAAGTDNIGVKYYNIYRSIAGTSFKLLASVSSQLSYGDTAVAPLTDYFYYVKSVDYAKNESPASDTVNGITLSLNNNSEYIRVTSPNGGECYYLPGFIHITWTGSNVNQAAVYFGSDTPIYLGPATSYDYTLTDSVSVTNNGYVKVVAIDNNGNPGQSDTNDQPFTIAYDCKKISASPSPASNSGTVPAVPTFFRSFLLSESSNVKLSWVDNSMNETEFRIYRRSLPNGAWGFLDKTTTNVTSYTDINVAPGSYEYDVDACNSSGCSVYSNQSQITAISSLPTAGTGKIYTPADLKDGDMVSATNFGDPDIFIINNSGYKRLFLNQVIFNFYGQLGGFRNVKSVALETRDLYKTSGLFRNCETNDPKVYGIEITGEDTGTLHWINTTGDKAVSDDPDFFKKIFCINNNEFNWYKKGSDYTSVGQIPSYNR